MLCPHAYQANLDIWSFYRDNPLSAFPSYDVELISDGPLTYTDLHYNVFEWDSTLTEIGLLIDPPPEVASEISQLLKQYTGRLKHCTFTCTHKCTCTCTHIHVCTCTWKIM